MSSILSALANGVVVDSFSDNSSATSGGHYNLLCSNCNRNNFFPGEDGPWGSTLPSTSGDTPNLQNLAPELNDPSITRLKFIVLGVMGSFLAVLGFLGNTMSIVVLQQRQMRSSTSFYLLSLAIYDNIVLLSMLFYFIIPSLATHVAFLKSYLVAYSITEPIGYPLSLTAQMGSIYTCVGFTVERFIAVCRPLQVANTCTKSRTVRAIILIFVWAVLYNIPRFFHLQAVYFYQDPAAAGSIVEGVQTTLTSSSAALSSSSLSSSLGAGGSAAMIAILHPNSSSSSSSSSSTFHAMPSHRAHLAPCSDELQSTMSSDFMKYLYSRSSPCYKTKSMSTAAPLINDYASAPFSPTDTIIFLQGDTDTHSGHRHPFDISTSSTQLKVPSSHASPHGYRLAKDTTTIYPQAFSFTTSLFSILSRNSISKGYGSMSTSSSSSLTTDSPDKTPPMTFVKALPTSFGSNPLFRNLYLIYSQLFFMFLLPFLIILFMNIGLIRAVKRSKSMQAQMASSASARKEHNLTVMLIAVIVVFLVCQFPTIIDNMLIAVFGILKLYPNYQYQCFYTACTLMVLINSASNFLLYCFFGKKFRVVFLSLLGIKKRQQYVAYRSTMYRSRSNGSRVCDVEVSVV